MTKEHVDNVTIINTDTDLEFIRETSHIVDKMLKGSKTVYLIEESSINPDLTVQKKLVVVKNKEELSEYISTRKEERKDSFFTVYGGDKNLHSKIFSSEADKLMINYQLKFFTVPIKKLALDLARKEKLNIEFIL